MVKYAKILVILTMLLGALPVLAAEKELKAGEKELKVAKELVTMILSREAHEKMIGEMTNAMLEQFRQGGQKLPADMDKKMKAVVLEVVPYDELLGWWAEVYASRFTVEELNEIGKFYKLPVGKKLIKLLPDLSGEVGKKMGTLLPERMPAAMKKAGLLPEDEEAPKGK